MKNLIIAAALLAPLSFAADVVTAVHGTITKVDPKIAAEHNESLVRVLMTVPDEIPLQLHHFELIVVHFRDDPGLPALGEHLQLRREIDCLVPH